MIAQKKQTASKIKSCVPELNFLYAGDNFVFRRPFKSVACARVFSVTSGTAFADHTLPLKTILKVILTFATNVKGISAFALSKQLRVAYQAAFVLLHKIRESITSNVDHRPLEGLVHIDGVTSPVGFASLG